MACQIAEYGSPTNYVFLHVEMFYNPDNVRRFGTLLWGDEVFGDAGGSGAARWVDVTEYVADLQILRGQQRPDAFTPSDVVTFNAVDPYGEFVTWTGEQALASPTVGTPTRVGFSVAATPTPGVPGWVATTLVDQITEQADVPLRTLEISTLGTKSMLATPLFFPDRPQETAQERIQAVITQIGFPYPIVYDPVLAAINLEADDGGSGREGAEAYASAVIEEAANSAGLQTYTDNEGTIRFASVGFRPVGVPLFTVSNCFGTGEDAVANEITYRMDAVEVLNVVQVINRLDPQRSAEASDNTSIALYGRRADGYGFPLTTVNQSGTEAQLIADQILSETKDIVNRVENVTINTLTDERWWPLFPLFSMYDSFLIVRDEPVADAFFAQLIGYTMAVGQSGVEMVLNTSTIPETPDE